MTKICLSMIVKNEEHIIRRCLDSVRSFVDFIVIADTGSQDNTVQSVNDWLVENRIPGEIFESEWQDFGTNRSICIERAELSGCEYILIMDADDVLEFNSDAYSIRKKLDFDCYNIALHDNGSVYHRPLLFRSKKGFRFKGVLHEFLFSEHSYSTSTLSDVWVRSRREGARSRDADKYIKDARLLSDALLVEVDDHLRSRYTFYLAQSFQDAGDLNSALKYYLNRIEMGHWDQEQFISALRCGRIYHELGDIQSSIRYFQIATGIDPQRAEPYYEMSKIYRIAGDNKKGIEAARVINAFNLKQEGLFCDAWIYEYALIDELSVNAYWVGEYELCRNACLRLLNERNLPEHYRERVQGNLRHACNALLDKGLQKQRIAIITPYYKENRSVIERCIASVRGQTVSADHFLVSDGFPQEWIDKVGVRHIRIDRSHGDFGNTPRALGALLAVAENYDAIGLLDADCWLEPDHVELCLNTAKNDARDLDFVVGQIIVRRPDGSEIKIGHESFENHVDTNSFFFLRKGFHHLSKWGMIPRETSVVGDRIFFKSLRNVDVKFVVVDRSTVNYTCLWASTYRAIGENLPAGAKENPDHEAVQNWIFNLSKAELATYERWIGLDLTSVYPRPANVLTSNDKNWAPDRPLGGTELMHDALLQRIEPGLLSKIELTLNSPPSAENEEKPSVVWIHHDIDQLAVRWLNDHSLVKKVSLFVFVSEWQKGQFLETFALPPEKCLVLRNATRNAPVLRMPSNERKTLKFAYTSVPYRGLSVLFDAWKLAKLNNAELHVWSSTKLYGPAFNDENFSEMLVELGSYRNCYYHSIQPNSVLFERLKGIDVLAYPSIFRETSCLSVIDAMAAGAKVLCSGLGALPETCGGHAYIYQADLNYSEHVKQFSELLGCVAEEQRAGLKLDEIWARYSYIRDSYTWEVRAHEWRRVLESL